MSFGRPDMNGNRQSDVSRNACGDRVNVLGVGVSAIDLPRATELFVEALRERRRGYICVTGVHGVMEAQGDGALRTILNRAFLCTPDGMPMVWLGRIYGRHNMGRVYGPDLLLEICSVSEAHGFRHFFYGGAQGAALELRDKLLARFPGLCIVGCYEPPFRSLNTQEETELASQMQIARPDVVWVGLSTPKQEKFMAEYLPKLDTTLMVGVGAAFDIHSGRLRQAPRWMQRSGLEWLFRLIQEPRRLWRRYFHIIPRFVCLALGQMLRLKKYSLE
jgi:N-acetylglucosaminyldiphosphoundecaprenol N-acetyl-beta-D-mannosaminyltransferase